MASKRMTLELSIDQYEFVRKEAAVENLTVSGFIRALIDERRASPARLRESYRDDPSSRILSSRRRQHHRRTQAP